MSKKNHRSKNTQSQEDEVEKNTEVKKTSDDIQKEEVRETKPEPSLNVGAY